MPNLTAFHNQTLKFFAVSEDGDTLAGRREAFPAEASVDAAIPLLYSSRIGLPSQPGGPSEELFL
jgi:hypothetical protein